MKSEHPTVLDVRAIDVGYFSVKFTLGRKIVGNSSTIATGLFPSLAPRLSSRLSHRSLLESRPDGGLVVVDDVSYFVGRDSILYSSGREPREVLDDYCLTDKYMALLRGALHYIAVDSKAGTELVIRQLVVGLPMNNFVSHRAQLQKRVQGEHLLPDPMSPGSMRRVTVQNAAVMVQPQGGLIGHFAGRQKPHHDGWVLVVDPGGGTLDWYVARGRHPNWQRSGAYPKSMLSCAYAVADRINPTWRDNYEIVERIDRAIRDQAPSFTTGGQTYDLLQFGPEIEAVIQESIDKMVSRLGSLDNLDLILFTGGGARVFHDHFSRRFPQFASILTMDEDPVYTNVTGFQIAGEIMAAPAKA